MKEPKIPELTCEGCKARDAMIQRLSARVDVQAAEIDRLRALRTTTRERIAQVVEANWGAISGASVLEAEPRRPLSRRESLKLYPGFVPEEEMEIG